jgi:hypothetical protein
MRPDALNKLAASPPQGNLGYQGFAVILPLAAAGADIVGLMVDFSWLKHGIYGNLD